ncbi:hypothetical protein EYF80_055383 [Liparis tanakae]|uniref:Uncharacterized protein n=1 Tax=Liparis tanakae TaxID=230148 RepID=A0A4Z2F010_9TELE|nr:hypothetical protein EYF80_055383 [Liparis tanakae]
MSAVLLRPESLPGHTHSCARGTRGTRSSAADPRDGAVAVALQRRQEARRGDALTEVVTGVGAQSEVAVNKRHEGKGLLQTLEVGFLLWKYTLKGLSVLYPVTFRREKVAGDREEGFTGKVSLPRDGATPASSIRYFSFRLRSSTGRPPSFFRNRLRVVRMRYRSRRFRLWMSWRCNTGRQDL